MTLTAFLAFFDEWSLPFRRVASWNEELGLARERIIEGFAQYGDAWIARGVEGNLLEAKYERADDWSYKAFAAACKKLEEKGDLNGTS